MIYFLGLHSNLIWWCVQLRITHINIFSLNSIVYTVIICNCSFLSEWIVGLLYLVEVCYLTLSVRGPSPIQPKLGTLKYVGHRHNRLIIWRHTLGPSTGGTLLPVVNGLKRLNQAKIIKKSVILFWLVNMAIWCKHVHRLELQKFCNFCAAHLPVKRDIETKSLYFLFWTCVSEIRNLEFCLYLA